MTTEAFDLLLATLIEVALPKGNLDNKDKAERLIEIMNDHIDGLSYMIEHGERRQVG